MLKRILCGLLLMLISVNVLMPVLNVQSLSAISSQYLSSMDSGDGSSTITTEEEEGAFYPTSQKYSKSRDDVFVSDRCLTQLVIRVNDKLPDAYARLMDTVSKYGGEVINTVSVKGLVIAVIVEIPSVNARLLARDVSINGLSAYIEHRVKFQAQVIPNDPYWNLQWGPQKIEADWAWNTTIGDPSVLVAVIDTGIDWDHPDLAANYVALGYDWVNDDPDPMDDNGHGTHCAGIIAAVINNSIGVAGLAQVRIMAEKGLNYEGEGYEDWLANAIIHAVDQGADILSLSWGSYEESELIHEAIKYAYDNEVLIIAAAGNDATSSEEFPAAFPEVIAVTATDEYDEPASWTNFGDWVELAAPGVSIYSTIWDDGYAYMSGTSMAAPHVAGVAALAWSRFPNASRDWVRHWLGNTADDLGTPGFDIYYGYGRVNARRAVQVPPEHDLRILSLESPLYVKPGNTAYINTTVFNVGTSNESDVIIQLFVNGSVVDSALIDFLASGTSTTVSCMWTPTVEGTYNVTSYVVPVPGESFIADNWATKFVMVGYPIIIGIIETHGETLHSEELVDYYMSLGYIVEKITSTITSEILSNYDVVMVGEDWADTLWLSSEIEAVEAFINSGGGFVAIGDELAHSVQEILGMYGISYTGISAPGGSTSNFDHSHPIMQGVSFIYAAAPVNSLQITAPAYWIANDVSNTYIIIAGAEIGGYVLCLSNDFAAHVYEDDNEVMFQNIVNWMTVKYEHELIVGLEAPNFLEPSESALLNATVYNRGLNNETDVELFILINGMEVSSAVIPELLTGASYTLSYLWTPTVEGIYNVTAYVPPVPDENVTGNNLITKFIDVQMFPDILIVNDDDGSSWFRGTSFQEFELALTSAGYDYWVWNESSMGNPPLDFLLKFELVIWTCGDYWDWAVDSVDAETLEAYLAQGGNILLEGEDIGYDHDADNFMVNVAHAVYQVDDTGAPGLTVTDPTHPVTFNLPPSFNWLIDPPYDDGVSPTNGGAEVIRYTGTAWTAVTVFEGASSGSVVYYAFPLYCLPENERNTLAINSINWLLGIRYEHELAVKLETPSFVEPGSSSLLNATVYNWGLSNESNVELQLLINGSIADSVVIPELPVDSSYTLSYLWTPATKGTYNITAYVPPIPGENITANNIATKNVLVRFMKYVLWDDVHDGDGDSLTGNYLSLYQLLSSSGFIVDELTSGTITSELLVNYDILVLIDPEYDFSSSEISAIHEWVLSGGGLIVIPDTGYPSTLNTIMAPYGVQLTGVISDYGTTTNIVPHPITMNVESIYYDLAWELAVSPPSNTLAWTLEGYAFLSASAGGEMVVISDSNLMDNDGLGMANNTQLILNIFNWIGVKYEHELTVGLEAPAFLEPSESALLNATVYNRGLNNETNVELQLLINDTIIESILIPELLTGEHYTLTYSWTPTAEETYNVTAYVPPVPGENVTINNMVSKFVSVRYLEVALFKNVDPWDYPANEEVLSLYGITYVVFSSSDFGLVDLSSFSKVIIASDQDQSFYDAMDTYRWWFEDYVRNGGILEIHAADGGWHEGFWVGTLPGDLAWVQSSSDYVTIVDPTHPVMTTPNLITDTELDGWFYSVHGYFSTYPADSRIVIIEDFTGCPAYLEFQYGSGFIIASSQTLEWAYMHEYSLILENSLLYCPIKYPHELAVTLDSPSLLEPGDSSLINATVYNRGLSNESNVHLQLLINGSIADSVVIPELLTGASYTLSYLWTPMTEGTYNVTAYAPPVPGENITLNNARQMLVSVKVLPDILIVNDDDGGGWVSGTSLIEFKSALEAAGYDYWVWNESSMGNPPLDFLLKFELVIWTCGDYWGWAVDSVDAETLEAYLAQGGNILLEGEDIGYNHDADDFMINVAHAMYGVDDTGAPGLTVTDPTHPVTFNLPPSFNWLTDPPYDDGVSPTNGGAEVIRYTGTAWTAVTVFEGNSSGSVVYYAFPLYCLPENERNTLAINSINWLLGIKYPPVANFTWHPSIPKVGELVTFDASASTPDGGTIVKYEWDFGDGETATGKIVSHSYANPGIYTVTLNVTDSQGLWDVEEKQIQVVQPHGPKAEFTWTPETPKAGEKVLFNASSSLPGWNGTHIMPITEYRWNFGDGNITTTTTPIIYHTYEKPGFYYVTLTVHAPGATPGTDSITHKIIVPVITVGGKCYPIETTTFAIAKSVQPTIIATITIMLMLAITAKKKKKK